MLNLAEVVSRHNMLVLPATRTTMASSAEERSARVSAAASKETEASPASA